MMKKMLLLTTVAAILLSCSKDDDGNGPETYTLRVKSNSLAQMNLKGSVKEMRRVQGPELATYSFNAAGNVVSVLPGRGFVYDEQGRLTNFVNNLPGSMKSVAITYGTHDKYIYLDELASEEGHFSPFVKGVERVVAVHGDEPSYTVTATYDVASGSITFSRTGDGAGEYSGTMDFDDLYPDMPSRFFHRGRATFNFYYSPTTGNITRSVRDVAPNTLTEYFNDDRNNYVNQAIAKVGQSENMTQYRYDEAGDLYRESFVTATREITYTYTGYDDNGNWTARTGTSGYPAIREISYY